MNILITGGAGFLAKELRAYFRTSTLRTKVLTPDRAQLNILDRSALNYFFIEQKVDVIIHTAFSGTSKNDTLTNFVENMAMFNNLRLLKERFSNTRLFNFCSGAAFGRNTHISQMPETYICYSSPKDYYGLAKNLIAKEIQSNNEGIYNLRLFGCFGKYENPKRFIRKSIENVLSGQPIHVLENKQMDFFYAQDVGRVIEHILKEELFPIHDINLAYSEKYTLMDIARKIKQLTKDEKNVMFEGVQGLSYTGCADTLYAMNVNLAGFDKGLEEVYDYYKKRNT